MILVAEYLEDPNQRVVAEVEGTPFKIGRNPTKEAGEDVELFRITWNDRLVNRNHSMVRREGSDLVIERLPAMADRRTPNSLYANTGKHRRERLDMEAEVARLRGGSLAGPPVVAPRAAALEVEDDDEHVDVRIT